MSIITINSDKFQNKISFTAPALLSALLKDFSIPTPCGGNHTCGKCKVKAVGLLSEISADERKILTEAEIKDGVRLSCAAFAKGDCEVWISSAAADHSAVLLDNANQSIGGEGFSIACDIGTTTIAVYLYKDGKQLRSLGEQNEQGKFGADVITRIGANTPKLLHECVVNQLEAMFKKCAEGIAPTGSIKNIVITGNTTMLHFLMGYDPSGIAVYPFTPKSLFDVTFKASELFPDFINAEVYLPPCISSYVGADVLCSVIASDMLEKDKISVLADIGTNGEMAIYKDGKLFTCSTAAGPALEGATIKMGTVAKKGAITKVCFEQGEIKYETIGNEAPIGICGSGLITLMATLLETGLVDESGMIDDSVPLSHLVSEEDDGSFIKIGDSGVILTQKDVRQFQLAKSAICAGILTLLHECDITADEVERFYICGGFGSYIDISSAVKTGLIPSAFKDKTTVLGNAAGNGAAILTDIEKRSIAKEISSVSSDLELSANEYFMEQYVERMFFSEI